VTDDAPRARALVLGVGNPLMSDDGVGLRLLQGLGSSCSLEGVEFVDAGTLSLLLLPRLEAADGLLVLDAAHFEAAAGTVRALEGPAMDEFLRSSRCSVHEVGLRDLLDAARLTGGLPQRRAFVGVQPLAVGWGETLSPAVEAAVPGGVALGLEILARWMRGSGS
jgi:hydrogenase maturation protease